MSHNLNAVILAAGQGKRMKSGLPKVMHPVGGKPMLERNINLARDIGCSTVCVVIGHGAELIRERYSQSNVVFCTQEDQKGTGHAVEQARASLDQNALAVILYGDVPMLKQATLVSLLEKVDTQSMGLLTARARNPEGLGRIIRNSHGEILAIVEHRDASIEQLAIDEVNTGIMVIPVDRLNAWLPRLRNDNDQGEYYLTDVIAMAVSEKFKVHTLQVDDEREVAGVNNRRQLAEMEQYYQEMQTGKFMDEGVTFLAPGHVYFRGDITLGTDVTIDMNVIMEGRVSCGNDVTIGPGCVLKNCTIGDGTVIEAFTHIEDAVVGKLCKLGPFARLRPGTQLAGKVKIGNFVETKKASIGRESKVNHFSYIGDATLGVDVNIGAGTIICNYDGVNKHQTVIGDGVFIGSNSTVVSPVTLADKSFVAAGSTITGNVAEGQLAVARGRQRNIDGWQRPVKKTNE